MEKTIVDRAIAAAGSQIKLAAAVGVTRQAVHYWQQKSKRIPAEFVLPVERATGIPRSEIRPDLYPPQPGEPNGETRTTEEDAAGNPD